MSNYSSTIDIQCPVDAVFNLVSDPVNMPKFLPTLQEAHWSGSDRVEMEGNAAGHAYHADGDLHLNPGDHTMTWGSESGHRYHGELRVEGDQDHSSLTVNLSFEPGQKMEEAVKNEKPDADAEIQQSLERSLQSIKELCEGRGATGDAPDHGPVKIY